MFKFDRQKKNKQNLNKDRLKPPGNRVYRGLVLASLLVFATMNFALVESWRFTDVSVIHVAVV